MLCLLKQGSHIGAILEVEINVLSIGSHQLLANRWLKAHTRWPKWNMRKLPAYEIKDMHWINKGRHYELPGQKRKSKLWWVCHFDRPVEMRTCLMKEKEKFNTCRHGSTLRCWYQQECLLMFDVWDYHATGALGDVICVRITNGQLRRGGESIVNRLY